MMAFDDPRSLTVWTAVHDNGWVTQAIERPDGTFAAWAIPRGEMTSGPDYIEMDLENAKRAAEYALRTKSGHQQCSAACTVWESHAHVIDVADSTEQ